MSCHFPYIQEAPFSNKEKARLEDIHYSIIEQAKKSQAFQEKENKLYSYKNKFNQATAFVKQMMQKYGLGIVKLISVGNNNHILNINVLPLTNEKQGEIFFNLVDKNNILLQKDEEILYYLDNKEDAVKIDKDQLKKVKQILDKIGLKVTSLLEYAKSSNLDLKGVNGLADLYRGIIAIAEGKEDTALTEEMVHIATAIIEQTHPALITEMISKIERFSIYKKVLEQYKNNKNYQLANGKPDIRKIKKEAVDKLIVEIFINNNANVEQNPELREEVNVSWIRNIWQKILDFLKRQYKKTNIDIFEKTAELIDSGNFGNLSDLNNKGVYFNLSKEQEDIVKPLLETQNKITKEVTKDTKPDPLTEDVLETNNFYSLKKPDGSRETILKRVTDRVKKYYKDKFGVKIFTKEEIKANEFKREMGILGHSYFEEIQKRYFNTDGTKREKPIDRPKIDSVEHKAVYDKLEQYFVDLVNSFEKGSLFLSEVIIYDETEKEAGTIDLLVIEPSGKTNIFDWKFMDIKGYDVAFYKTEAFNIQLSRYAAILKNNYGVKQFGKKRAIPIAMELKKTSKTEELYLSGINIGSVDASKIEDLKLIPISESTESTGNDVLDQTLTKLNALLAQIEKEKTKNYTEREFKLERLNTLRVAIKYAMGMNDLSHLIDVIELVRVEGEKIIEDYEMIYKDKVPTTDDFKNTELSDFSERLNSFLKTASIFENLGRDLRPVIYSADLQKNVVTPEQKEDAENRKKISDKLLEESDQIYSSLQLITKTAKDFSNKHIGERNFVTGFLNPQKVIKGFVSNFRSVSDLGSKALDILVKLTTSAQTKASKDAFEEVSKLMEIRKKLVEKGGDLKKLVSLLYQKDDENKFVNKLIYKTSKEYREEVEKNTKKEWLLANVDIENYKKEAQSVIDRNTKYINERVYTGSAEEVEYKKQLALKSLKDQYDIDSKTFIGFNNYIIKNNPLPKWYSKEYKEIEKNPELLELYKFILAYNEKSKNVGYIDNQISKNFLPFVRKSMAEELVWNERLPIMDNFYKSLQLDPSKIGYGEINEITGQLENSIPRYYTKDFTNTENGVNDHSEVSEDIFKNLILYIQSVEKYKYLSEVEEQIKLIKTVESFKNHYATNRLNKVVFEDGKPVEIFKNEENTKLFDDFMRVLLYDQKYLSSDDTALPINKILLNVKKAINQVAGKKLVDEDSVTTPISLTQTIDTINRGFQLKTLGLDLISGAVNWFGNNIQILAQSGHYFKSSEFFKNEAKLVGQNFKSDEDKDLFVKLIETFLPLKEDPSYMEYKKAGMHALTKNNVGDMLFVFMRKPEILVEKTIFLTLLENTMVVNGNIVNINEFVKSKYKGSFNNGTSAKESLEKIEKEAETLKKEKSIAVTSKLADGKLVIPGLNLENYSEIQRLTNLTHRLTNNATGGMSKENTTKMSMSVWTKSMMVFKNWIPKLADTRFSEFRKTSDDFSVRFNEKGVLEGQKYDVGRLRLLGHFVGVNIIKKAIDIHNVIKLNDAGLVIIDELLEEYRKSYKEDTGEDLTISREDFMELICTNLSNQVRELGMLLSLIGLALFMKVMAPDDDDDKSSKNFFRYSQKVIDRFVSELFLFIVNCKLALQ